MAPPGDVPIGPVARLSQSWAEALTSSYTDVGLLGWHQMHIDNQYSYQASLHENVRSLSRGQSLTD